MAFLDYTGLTTFKTKLDGLFSTINSLNSEINRAKQAEATNASNISAEVTRAKQAENALNAVLAVSCKNNYLGTSLVSNGGSFRIQDISVPFSTTEQSGKAA